MPFTHPCTYHQTQHKILWCILFYFYFICWQFSEKWLCGSYVQRRQCYISLFVKTAGCEGVKKVKEGNHFYSKGKSKSFFRRIFTCSQETVRVPQATIWSPLIVWCKWGNERGILLFLKVFYYNFSCFTLEQTMF